MMQLQGSITLCTLFRNQTVFEGKTFPSGNLRTQVIEAIRIRKRNMTWHCQQTLHAIPRRISSRSLSRTSPVKASHPATAHLLRVTAPRKNFVHTESAIPRWGAVWVWARRANENSCLVYVYHHLTDCVVVLAAPVTCM